MQRVVIATPAKRRALQSRADLVPALRRLLRRKEVVNLHLRARIVLSWLEGSPVVEITKGLCVSATTVSSTLGEFVTAMEKADSSAQLEEQLTGALQQAVVPLGRPSKISGEVLIAVIGQLQQHGNVTRTAQATAVSLAGLKRAIAANPSLRKACAEGRRKRLLAPTAPREFELQPS